MFQKIPQVIILLKAHKALPTEAWIHMQEPSGMKGACSIAMQFQPSSASFPVLEKKI